MAIDLRKLLQDIRTSDEDIVVLALRTLKRIRPATLVNDPEVSRLIIGELERLREQGCDDVEFFANECLEFVRKTVGVAETPAIPRPSASKSEHRPEGRETRSRAVETLKSSVSEASAVSAALIALRRGLSAPELPLVKKHLRHKDPAVRVEAVVTIASYGDERLVLENLLPFLRDRDEAVRKTVVAALRATDQNRLLAAVEAMLRSKKIGTKIIAVYLLGYLQGPDVVRLLGLAARDSSEEVRSCTVDALKTRRGKDVLVILKGLVNDLDIDVAEKALAIYEDLKVQEGILNSSVELGDSLMQKLREISAESDKELGLRSVRVTEYMVPKTDRTGLKKSSQPEPAATGKPLSRCSEAVQRKSEEIYDQLDDVLEQMGRKIWLLEKANKIVDKRFNKLNYDIQRYEDMLLKRKKAAAEGGYFSRLSAGNRRIQEKQQLNLEFSLSERYRMLGELAVELSHSEDSEFKELEDYYREVETLLRMVRDLKAKN